MYPFENECSFGDIGSFIFKTDSEESTTGINTFIPRCPKEKKSLLESLDFDFKIKIFSFKDIHDMTTSEIEKEIQSVESELDFGISSNNVVSPSFDPHLSQSVCIHADVNSFDFVSLGKVVQFDVILMDPLWKLSGAEPSHGVTLRYSQMDISRLNK
jgi:hypothetical protein